MKFYNRNKAWTSLISLCLLVALVACGGGGPLADGGIGGTGVVSSGSVSALGSIEVNGVHYLVAGATYTREDEAPVVLRRESQTSMRVGMVVDLEGELSSGSSGQAMMIGYEDVVEGQIDPGTVSELGGTLKVLTVLQQQVIVDAGFTAMNGVSYAGLDSFSGMLEVSGFRLNDGRIQATYLESRNPGRYEVKGVVTAASSGTFDLGTLAVSYAGPVAIAVGDLVEVKGSAYTAPILTATSVTHESGGFKQTNKAEAEIEGFVDGADPIAIGAQFTVDGQLVISTAATQFDGGSARDLVRGAKVEAEGDLTAGILTARRISFKEGVRLEGDIDTIDIANGTLTLLGLNDVNVIVDPATTELKNIVNLAGLSPGDHVRLRGQLTAIGGVVQATRIELRSPSADVVLRGPVEDNPVVPDQVTILGVSVDTTPITTFLIEEDDGSVTTTTSNDFFNRLPSGEIVKLEGILSGAVVNWSAVQKQNEL